MGNSLYRQIAQSLHRLIPFLPLDFLTSSPDNAPMQTPPVPQSPPVFHGPRFDVHTLYVNGRQGQMLRRDVVVHPGAAVVLGVLETPHQPDKPRVLMIRTHRFAVGQELWELPAGTIEPREHPRTCAVRELTEETGYSARRMTPLISFFSSPGICNEKIHAFLAQDLTRGSQNLDEGEQITVVAMPLARALSMVMRGHIQDAKTIATLLYYDKYRMRRRVRAAGKAGKPPRRGRSRRIKA